MYWVLGAMKSFHANVGGYPKNYMEFLKTNILPHIQPETVFNAIMSHDVDEATSIANKVWKLLPNYKEQPEDLRNKMSGGGGGTKNPYFYEQSLRVFLEGNMQGVSFADDMQHNWGLYEDYVPKHHSYWGIQQAMVGMLDADIFPYMKVLGKVWPNDMIQKKPTYTHPLNGGNKKYVINGAAAWLR
jgi:hypothetical protein